ncbi:AraC family transcriptional regulator ligand-binding domain-containing protein [Thalassotalea fusca]
MRVSLPHYTVRTLLNFLARQGLSRQVLLSLIESDEQALNDPKQQFTIADYEHLIDFGVKHLGIKNIGFIQGKAFDLSSWGLLGHIVLAAPTLWDALAYQRQFQCLMGNSGSAHHEIDGDVVTVRWLSDLSCSDNSNEQVITAWVAFAFNVTQTQDKPISVHFTHDCMTTVDEYQAFFGCPVHFNANFNGIKIHLSSLSLPLTTNNQEVLSILSRHAENKVNALRSSASLELISQYIVETLPERVPELNEVATFLGISVRQLQRQFQKEQTNLTQLIDSIRQRLALSYLSQTDHKLLYISAMLGYSEQSAFQRAFKRWFQVTPQEYRLRPHTTISQHVG